MTPSKTRLEYSETRSKSRSRTRSRTRLEGSLQDSIYLCIVEGSLQDSIYLCIVEGESRSQDSTRSKTPLQDSLQDSLQHPLAHTRMQTRSNTLIAATPPSGGGLLFCRFPNQETGGRGSPSKHLVKILRGGSSSSGFLIKENDK